MDEHMAEYLEQLNLAIKLDRLIARHGKVAKIAPSWCAIVALCQKLSGDHVSSNPDYDYDGVLGELSSTGFWGACEEADLVPRLHKTLPPYEGDDND